MLVHNIALEQIAKSMFLSVTNKPYRYLLNLFGATAQLCVKSNSSLEKYKNFFQKRFVLLEKGPMYKIHDIFLILGDNHIRDDNLYDLF